MKIINFITGLLFTFLVASVASNVTGMDMGTAFAGCAVGSVLLSFAPIPKGIASAVVLRQMWEAELITAFRSSPTWLSRVPRKDQYVGNNVINLQEIGADPNVLINNAVYPIPTAGRNDNTLPLALYKYDTENTKVTRDEMEALPYDKEGSVIAQHRETLVERTAAHGLWNLSPAGNTASSPLVSTTGVDNGNSRKRMKGADLIALKQKLDNLKVPKQGRVLILCADHVSDLLLEDQSFQLRYNNTAEGSIIGRFYGFDIFEDVTPAIFDASNAKKAFGAAAVGTDRNSSTCFFAPRAFQATGTVEMFYQDKYSNPTMRESVVGFQVYHVVAPLKNLGFGAIVSDSI